MTNTRANIGIRRFIRGLNDYRNFEPGGTVQYVSNKSRLTINGIVYQPGTALPLGALPDEKLVVLFNQGDINPAA
jgi:hypothetical protein